MKPSGQVNWRCDRSKAQPLASTSRPLPWGRLDQGRNSHPSGVWAPDEDNTREDEPSAADRWANEKWKASAKEEVVAEMDHVCKIRDPETIGTQRGEAWRATHGERRMAIITIRSQAFEAILLISLGTMFFSYSRIPKHFLFGSPGTAFC